MKFGRPAVAGISIVVALGAAVGGYLLSSETTNAAEEAERIVRECAGEQEKDKCYERVVPGLYEDIGVAPVFDVIRAIRQIDRSYQFCHVLAHEVGVRVVAEDPTKWIDAIPLNPPDGLCSNGYIHGVVTERFRAEVLDDATIDSLISDFSRACEARPDWRPSDLDRAICYHGLGHLYVFITDADMEKALSVCARTTSEQFRRVCIEGVFMQIFQPLEPDDFELIARMPVQVTKDNVRSFCAAYGRDDFEGACLRESWPLFEDGIRSGSGVEAFCSGHPSETEERHCYESVTAIIGRGSLDDSSRATAACSALLEKWQGTCFTVVARAVIEEDRNAGAAAVALCQRANERIADECLKSIASTASFIFGADQVRMSNFCAALPSSYRALCR